jgi:hypothetical protein
MQKFFFSSNYRLMKKAPSRSQANVKRVQLLYLLWNHQVRMKSIPMMIGLYNSLSDCKKTKMLSAGHSIGF